MTLALALLLQQMVKYVGILACASGLAQGILADALLTAEIAEATLALKSQIGSHTSSLTLHACRNKK